MTSAVRPRTQQERREATIGRILDATVAALGEVGYTATTIAEVCSRSGVSSGGVFRHFPTRLDLMVAAADEVRKRQFEKYREGLARLGVIDRSYESVLASLQLVRSACRAPINAAWYELLGAARTDPALRERLEPLAARYVEVYRGPNALQYGAATLGGAINFVSPTGRSAPPLDRLT